MTCVECGGESVVMGDDVALTMRGETLRVESAPWTDTPTAWCDKDFPNWLRGARRPAKIPKPHIQATEYGVLVSRMRGVNVAVQRITEAALAGAEAARQLTETYERDGAA